MKTTTTLLAALMISAFALPALAIPTISAKKYRTAKSAAAGGGAYAMTRRLVTKGYKPFNTRQVKVNKQATPKRWNMWSIRTRAKNPNTGKPLAKTTVQVVKGARGGFHFLHEPGGALTLSLPAADMSKSPFTAARATAAKTFLGDSNLAAWYADRGNAQGSAAVMKQLKTKLLRETKTTKTIEVYHRYNGQDGEPMMSTTVTVKKLKGGVWGKGKVGALTINDIWE